MINKVLVFLYVFTQVLFYDSLTIVPKLIGALLAFTAIFSLNRFPSKALVKLPIISLFLLLIHAVITTAVNPYLEDSQGIISFALVSILLLFVYIVMLIHNLWRTAIWGFTIGIYVNFLLVLFFSTSFDLSGEWGRVDGTLGNPNYFGFMVNFSVVFYIWLKKTSTIKWPFLLDLVIYSLSAYHIVISGSKSNIVLFVIIMLMLMGISVFNSGKIKLLRNTVLIISSVILLLVYVPDFFSKVIDQDSDVFRRLSYIGMFLSGESSLGSSDQSRVELVNYGLKYWVDKPIFGHGFDSFTFMSGFGFYSHNNLVENLFNAGLFGFFVFYSMYVFYFKLFKNLVKKKLIDIKIPVLILIIFLLMEISIVMIDDKLIWLILLILLAYLENNSKKIYD